MDRDVHGLTVLWVGMAMRDGHCKPMFGAAAPGTYDYHKICFCFILPFFHSAHTRKQTRRGVAYRLTTQRNRMGRIELYYIFHQSKTGDT